MKKLTIALGLVLLFSTRVYGAAWTLEEGADSVIFIMGYDSWATVYNGDGDEISPPTRVNNFDVALSWEHGVTDDFTFGLLVPYSWNWVDDESLFEDQSGIGDTRLTAKYKIMMSDPVALSLQAGLKLPGEYDATALNTPGDGQHDLDLTVLASRFFGTRFLVNADLGYRFRGSPKGNEWFANLEFGITPMDNLWVQLHFQYLDSLSGKDLGDETIFPELEEDIMKAGISVNYTLDQWFIFGSYLPTIAGANTSKSNNIVAGIGINF